MHHISAYSGLVGTTANTDVAALADQVLTISAGNRFLFQRDTALVWTYAASTTISRARLTSPTLQQVGFPNIRPVTRAVGGINNPNIMDLRRRPLILPGLEEIGAQATTALAMGTERVTIIMATGQSEVDWDRYSVSIPDGDIIPVRFTGSTAAVANAWTDITMAPDDPIGAGEYAIVGGDWFSATGIAFRLLLDNQVHRPGGLCVAGVDRRGPLTNYPGNMGVWGRFRTTALPRFQLLAGAADANHECWLYIQRLYAIS